MDPSGSKEAMGFDGDGTGGPKEAMGFDGGGTGGSYDNGKDVSDEEMETSGCVNGVNGANTTACCDAEKAVPDNPMHSADEKEEAPKVVEKVNETPHSNTFAWLCHRCLRMNQTPKRCPGCKTWRSDAKNKNEKQNEKQNDVLHPDKSDDVAGSCGFAAPSASEANIKPETTSSEATDQLQSDAALAAQLAAMYENTPLSAAEKVKFGGRRRGQVSHFQPGGNPRETNPQEEYNLPPEYKTEPASKRPRISRLPGFNASTNPWRKPGRLSKEEEEKLKRAEEATVERLRAIMKGHRQYQNNGKEDMETSENVSKEAEGNTKTEPNRQIIQRSFVDLLSEPRRVTQHGVLSICVSFKPAALALSQQEAIEADRQLRQIFNKENVPSVGAGCTMSVVLARKAPRLGLDMNTLASLVSNWLFNHASNSMKADGDISSDAVEGIASIDDELCDNADISTRSQSSSPEELPNMVSHLLLYEADQEGDRVDAIAIMRSEKDDGRDTISRSIARISVDDLKYWAGHPSNDSSDRGLAFLERLVRPLCLRLQHVEGEKSQEGGETLDEDDIIGLFSSKHEHELGLVVLPFSFLDVLLLCSMIQPHVIDGIIRRVQLLHKKEEPSTPSDDKERILQQLLLQIIEPLAARETTRAFMTHRLSMLLASFRGTARDTLRQMIEQSMNTLPSDQFADASIASTDGKMKHILVEVAEGGRQTKAGGGKKADKSLGEARSCWANPTSWASSREMQIAIRRERRRLISDFEKNRQRQRGLKDEEGDKLRRSSRQIVQRGGHLIFSENEMPLPEFIRMKTLMREVNATFPREYLDASKPTLSAVQLSNEDVEALQDVFFDSDGSLKNDVKADIDSGAKNDPRYIVFFNSLCGAERTDTRWQVPIRHHSIGNEVRSRTKVEEMLSKVLVPGREQLDDIGLLFGGSEDQSLHHDTARQKTQWMKHRPFACDNELFEYDMIPGWEVERLMYNAAMASPYAPGSLLVGLHGGDGIVYLGVQRDYVLKMPGTGNKCKIKGGRKDEFFTIVRENEHLVVVAAAKGVVFTGDFPHAGVRNFPKRSEEQELMDLLNSKIVEINSKYPAHERLLRTKSYVQMMCDFPNLNKLCRLHCSTEMVDGQISTPHNMIGFDGCYPNAPDRRCFEDDRVDDNVEDEEAKSIGKPIKEDNTPIEPGKTGKAACGRGYILETPEHHESKPERLEGGAGTSSSSASMDKERKGDAIKTLSKGLSNEYNDGKPFIGKRCARGFDGFRFDATVTKYMPDLQLFRIAYDDGDTQEMNLREVKEAIQLYKSNYSVNGAKLCTVLSCNKNSQGQKCSYMCRSHYNEYVNADPHSSQSSGNIELNQPKKKNKKKKRTVTKYTTGGSPALATARYGARLLYHEKDEERLAPLICILRANIEVFPANDDDVKANQARANGDPVVVGQVGIRCARCRQFEMYPESISKMFDASRTYRRVHFGKCPKMPVEVREDFDRLRCRNGNTIGATEYWIASCIEAGMVNGDGGIFFATPS
mmetsp:Transcript_33797/g.73241  ORF Transcript_33797/g.73241 Transcript_33797/m.73241 type:complete len:1510 (+) Transcript_33797:223-4752(+)